MASYVLHEDVANAASLRISRGVKGKDGGQSNLFIAPGGNPYRATALSYLRRDIFLHDSLSPVALPPMAWAARFSTTSERSYKIRNSKNQDSEISRR